MNSELRCLSIRNPWAWTICLGENTVENRTWKSNHRGTIAIHASASRADFNSISKQDKAGKIRTDFFEFGAIIGLADIADIIEYGSEVEDNCWACGPYCWLMENGRFLEKPIPFKGRLNLFKLPEQIAREVRSQETRTLDPHAAGVRETVEILRPPLETLENYLFLTQESLQKGEIDAATRYCESSLRLEPNSGIGNFFRGFLYQHSGNEESALAKYDAALSNDPTVVDAYMYRGDLYFYRGELGLAWNDYCRASEQDPDWGVPHIGRAAVLNSRGDHAEAVTAASRAIALAPDAAMAYLRRAEGHWGLGDSEESLSDIASAIELDPQLFEALELRVTIHESNGDTETAKLDQEEAERIRSNVTSANAN